VVERDLAKVEVEGSNPFTRSIISDKDSEKNSHTSNKDQNLTPVPVDSVSKEQSSISEGVQAQKCACSVHADLAQLANKWVYLAPHIKSAIISLISTEV